MASDNAMTEIALALAMAFFSIMILTMVSMGAGRETAKAAAARTDSSIRALPVQATASATNSAEQTRVHKQDKVIVFHKGVFYDPALKPADPGTVTVEPPARIILAISPDLSMARALDARARFSSRDVIVTTLSDEWITRLKEMSR
jgi:hypothetical protein